MILLLIQFIGLFGFGLMLMEACKLRLHFFMEIPMAFVLGLGGHFVLTNAIAYFLHVNGFLFATGFFSTVGIGFLAWKFYQGRKKAAIRIKEPKSTFNKTGFFVLVGAFALFSIEYVVLCWSQIKVASQITGIIYQDFVYLIGVGRTILHTNQFPIPDIQIAGSALKYHTLAYHFTAFFLDSISQNEFFIYVVVVKLGTLLFAVWCFSVLTMVLWEQTLSSVQQILLILATLNVEFLLSGTNLTLFETYFSLSFCLQLAMFALMIAYVKQVFIERQAYTVGTVVIFLLLFAISILIKASSLILLPVWGILFLFLKLNALHRKEFFKLGVALTGMAVLIYCVFFLKEGGRGHLFLQAHEWNCTLCDVPVTGKYAGLFGWLDSIRWDEIFIGFISFLSFRFILIYRESNKWLYLSLLLLAGVFSTVIRQDAFAFYLPIIVVLSFFSIAKLMHMERSWIQYFGLAIMFLSLHPINSVGNYVGRKIGYKTEKSIPIDRDQYDFLKDMAKWIEPERMVYTFNHYSDSVQTSDYFFPAALSGRQMYVGGTRFAVNGNITADDLEARKEMVKAIESAPADEWLDRIAATGCSYVYIHKDINTAHLFEDLANVSPKDQVIMQDSANVLIKIR